MPPGAADNDGGHPAFGPTSPGRGPGGLAGVVALNGEAGVLTLESTGGTVAVTEPAGNQINLEVAALPATVFGAAPPNNGAVSKPGVALTASRSDHTHGAIIADWINAGNAPRFFACDTAAGNDANAGWSDVSGLAAGAVAVKTIGRLLQIVPRFGNGRNARVMIKSGNYASDPTVDISGFAGYTKLVIIGTDTVVTAGATAFTADDNDTIACGMTTATGLNSAGYNATAYSVDGEGTPTITLQLAGGGAPVFPAMPGRPYGCRLRWDNTTQTAALQNKCFAVIATPTSSGLIIASGLPATPVFGNAGDVCYIEMPNVTGPSVTICQGSGAAIGGATLQLCGLSWGEFIGTNTGISIAGCEFSLIVGKNLNISILETTLSTPGSQRTVGLGARTGGYALQGGNVVINGNADTAQNTTMSLQATESFTWERSSAKGMLVFGSASTLSNNIIAEIGTNSSTAHGATCQIWGPIVPAQGYLACGLYLSGGYYVSRVKFSNMGANPCVRFVGVCYGSAFANLSGGIADGNTDVGLDFSPAGLSGNTLGAMGCTIALVGTPSATGTNGDVRLAGGQIVSWTALLATGLTDSEGNRIISASGPLGYIPFSGSIVGAVGAVSSYFADGSIPVANIATAFRRPTSQRLALRLRFNPTTNTSANTTTVTLYKNGAPTAMQVSIPAGSTAKVVDSAHPILFADGDDYDIRGDDAADVAAIVSGSGCLEYSV